MRAFSRTAFNRIEVKPWEIHYNFRCHLNSVHYAKKLKHNRVAMVMYDNWDYISIHFINVYKDKKWDDYFVDNTVGEWSSSYEYYFVRWIMKEGFDDIGNVFTDYRRRLNKFLPIRLRLTTIFDDEKYF